MSNKTPPALHFIHGEAARGFYDPLAFGYLNHRDPAIQESI